MDTAKQTTQLPLSYSTG